MRTPNLILFCILYPFAELLSQDTTIFAPIGATWYYSQYINPPLIGQLFTFVSEGDTLLNGYNARIIGCYVFQNQQLERIDHLTKYVATTGNEVYYRVGNDFVLLYDFNGAPGDTIYSLVEEFPLEMGCHSDFSGGNIAYSYVIDSVGLIEIDGVNLRTQFIHVIQSGVEPRWDFFNPIIERIGNKEWGSFWWGRGQNCILEGNGLLRCYYDGDIMFRNPLYNGTFTCDFTEIELIKKDVLFQISPNPSNETISIAPDAKNIIIYNYDGVIIPFTINEGIIDIQNFIPGIYFLTCQSRGINFHGKFLKIN